jgi:hypothetical protein
VETAIALETVAAMATRTLLIDPGAGEVPGELLARHFDRKHGPTAYYGQPARAAGAAPRDGDDGRGTQ